MAPDDSFAVQCYYFSIVYITDFPTPVAPLVALTTPAMAPQVHLTFPSCLWGFSKAMLINHVAPYVSWILSRPSSDA